MILVSVDGFFQFLPKLVEEKVSSRTEKNSKNHGKNQPLEETANPEHTLVRLKQEVLALHSLRICRSFKGQQ